MLILDLKLGETVIINDNIVVRLLQIKGTTKCAMGFTGPKDVIFKRGKFKDEAWKRNSVRTSNS